ncbi:MAG: aminotransferase class V-fold PLP-dependent enzyme [Eubacteriales bacterium]|jgi:cysteine desulfurase family protein|nr:aminotransferase class V-fold PLP-dependent enzyme [Clostridiales bacterium]
MIYFNNAATTWPKPDIVYYTADTVAKKHGGNAGRGGNAMAVAAAKEIYNCRCALASFFGAQPENIIFTLNTTYAINMAIKSSVCQGSHILISDIEHNSVLRPVIELTKRGVITYDIFDTSGDAGNVIESIRRHLRINTRMLVCTHMSNIAPITLPIAEIGSFCRERGICFITDAAQSAGFLDINVEEMKIDALCIPGHKGLYGMQGCGALILGMNASKYFKRTFIEGGSGSDSSLPHMPEYTPDRFEAGTMPAHTIAALRAGVEWVTTRGVSAIRQHEANICAGIVKRLKIIPDIKIYYEDSYNGGAYNIVLFNIKGRSPTEVSTLLNERGICVRAGLHCAPMAHKKIGTYPGGAVRISCGVFNTEREAIRLTNEIKRIAAMPVK